MLKGMKVTVGGMDATRSYTSVTSLSTLISNFQS